MLLLLLAMVGGGTPIRIFGVRGLAPNVAIFKLSFVALFSTFLVSGSEKDSFLTQLCAAPLATNSFVLNCTLPVVPISILRTIVYCTITLPLKLGTSMGVLCTIVLVVPVSILCVTLKLLYNDILGSGRINNVYNTLLAGLST